ncbi:hypothetical protein PLACP1_17740 [Planifilum fimeticola]
MVFIIGHVIADPGGVIYKILRRTNNIKTSESTYPGHKHVPQRAEEKYSKYAWICIDRWEIFSLKQLLYRFFGV